MIRTTMFGGPRAVLAAVALALAAVAVLAGCATGTQHATAARQSAPRAQAHHAALTAQQAPATARHTFDPFTSSGTLAVSVARRTSGSCWATSLADPTRTAYRCFAGNQILDPCFASPGTAKGDAVACIADPWSKATVLTLTKALPRPQYVAHRVWAFRRADGATCVAATGTVPAVAGRNLDFICSDHTYAALNNPTAQRVTAVFAAISAHSLRTSAVRELWHS